MADSRLPLSKVAAFVPFTIVNINGIKRGIYKQGG